MVLAGFCICFIFDGVLTAFSFPAVAAAWLLLCPGHPFLAQRKGSGVCDPPKEEECRQSSRVLATWKANSFKRDLS